ncbi:MAG: redoxin domain-containing protein [Anaerolineales bacterium]|nr:redoxin domain-containing protein [Anaerolineales bacterium]MCX7755261.1 redoxin domain-containing protein [Anaerolineales bacterium]
MNLNAPAPDFALPDLEGTLHRLSDYRGRVVVINFWSAECPWSEQSDAELQQESEAWNGRVVLLRVASNVNESEEQIRQTARLRGLNLILKDTGAMVADLYAAQTTPHCFVIDPEGLLRYCGAFDDRTFRKRTASRIYLREAVNAVLAGHLPEPQETAPYGCTIVRPMD